MEDESDPDKHSYITHLRSEEAGGLIRTSVSPDKNHVTAISVNSPQDVLRSFRRELVTIDTTKQTVQEEHRNTGNSFARLENSSLRENHYHVPDTGLGNVEIAAPYSNVASDTEITLQYHSPYKDEYQSSRHLYSKDGRIFEKKGEHRRARVHESVVKGTHSQPRHHSVDLSKTFGFTDKTKYPKLVSKADYVYGHPRDHNKVYRSHYGGMYARKFHPRTARRVSYAVGGHYSDIETMNDQDYSRFDVISLASSSDTDVFVTADISDDNHKRRRSHDKLTRKYTVLSERDFAEEVPIYAHKYRWRSVSPVGRRYSTSRERPRSHSRHRRVVLSRPSRDSTASDEYDEDENPDGTSHTRGSTHTRRTKKRDIFSGNRNDESSTKLTSFGDFSALPYPINTIPPCALNTNFALYPFTGLSPTFQSPYAGFPFSATPAYTNNLYQNSALDFATVRNYLGAMSASLASIPAPAIGTSPYISQQILQSNIPDRLEGAGTQDLFNNNNRTYNNIHADGLVYSKSIDIKSTDKETTIPENRVLPANSIPLVADVPSATIGHTHTRLTDDSKNATQGHPRKVFELNTVKSHENINTHSSENHSHQDFSTNVSVDTGGNKIKNAPKTTADEGNEHKLRFIHSQLSKELSARFLSNANSTEKRASASPVQPDVHLQKSFSSNNSTSKSTPAESGAASSVTSIDRLLLKRSVSTDSQTPKSPPPTFPKPKCAEERVKSPVSPLPSQQQVVSDSSQQPVRRISAAHNERCLSTDAFPRSLGSDFFEILELKVIDLPESTSGSQDVNRINKTEKQTRYSKESRPLLETAGEKYSITQVCSPQMSTSENMVHPEADYDIYPRKLTTDTMPDLQDKPAVVHGKTQPLLSPTKVRFESPEPPQQTSHVSVRKIVNDYTRNILGSSSQPATPSTSGKSQPELLASYHKSFSNISKPMKYPADKATAAWNMSQRGGALLKSSEEAHKLSHTSSGVNYASLAPSAKSSHDRANTTTQRSPHSVKLNDTDTDFKDTSYHFYTGPLSLQPKSYHKSKSPPDITELIPLDNGARNIFDESFYNNMQKLPTDSVNEKYIFYKGSNMITSAVEDPVIPLFTNTHARNIFDESFYNNMQKLPTDSGNGKYIFHKIYNAITSVVEDPVIPLFTDTHARNIFDESFYNNIQKLPTDSANEEYIFYKGSNVIPSAVEDPVVPLFTKIHAANRGLHEDLSHSEPTRQISFSSKISDKEKPHPELDPQREDNVLKQKHVKTEVPIPPRDFDSDADNSEYLYTSQGWTHLPDRPITANVMYCTSVEDNSAAILHQLHKQNLQTQYPNESILEKFFRDCLPKNEQSLPFTNVRKSVTILDWPFLDELSKSSLSLKWTSEMNRPRGQSALNDPIVGGVPQRRGVNPETSDLDSGVSLASQMSIPSLNVHSDHNRGSIAIPGEDNSSTESISSRSSIQLGGDYLSWNDSLQQKKWDRSSSKGGASSSSTSKHD